MANIKRVRLSRRLREKLNEQRRRSRAAKKSWATRKKRQRQAKKRHKKFSAKSTSHRPRLQLNFKLRVPRGSTKKDVRAAIRVALRTGRLPKGFRPTTDKWVGWRNPNTKKGRTKQWQYDTLEATIPSFRRIYRRLFK